MRNPSSRTFPFRDVREGKLRLNKTRDLSAKTNIEGKNGTEEKFQP
jgi:hypothetical protein